MRYLNKYILILLLGIFLGKYFHTFEKEKELYALVESNEHMEPMEIGLPIGYDLVMKINFERYRNKFSILNTDFRLFCASQTHVNEIATAKECTHRVKNEYFLSKRVRVCGWAKGVVMEIVACGFDNAEDVMVFWMSNTKYVQTILDTKWSIIGCEEKNKYWVCVLG